MNKTEFAEKVARDTGSSKVAARGWTDAVLASLADAMATEDELVFNGLGKFKHESRKARVGRNSSNGEKIDIPPRVIVKYYPGGAIDDALKKLPVEFGDE